MLQEKLSVGLETEVSRRIEERMRVLSKQSPDFCVNWDLKRYYWFLEVGVESVRATLSEAEIFLLLDACRRSEMFTNSTPNGISGCRSHAESFLLRAKEALQTPRLLERHSTVGPAILQQKLEKLERFEVWALAEWLKARSLSE
jgi:hypothetical protein